MLFDVEPDIEPLDMEPAGFFFFTFGAAIWPELLIEPFDMDPLDTCPFDTCPFDIWPLDIWPLEAEPPDDCAKLAPAKVALRSKTQVMMVA